jgi:cellobiose phosphorylase
VAAADVSLGAGRAGQCGWTWYTGSAGWMYRVWMEEVLGFQVRGDRFRVDPVLPVSWPGFELTYRHGSTVYRIKVVRSSKGASVTLDGQRMVDRFVPLVENGGTRNVEILVDEPSPGLPQSS